MEQLLLGKIRGVAADAEISFCAGEQRWSEVVSVAQRAWSLNKERAVCPALMPSWGEVVGCGSARSTGSLKLAGFSWHWCYCGQGRSRGTGGWWGPTFACSRGLVQPWVSRVVQEQRVRTGFVCCGVQGSPHAVVGTGLRRCPTSLCWCPWGLSSFAQLLHCFNNLFYFSIFNMENEIDRNADNLNAAKIPWLLRLVSHCGSLLWVNWNGLNSYEWKFITSKSCCWPNQCLKFLVIWTFIKFY